MFNESWHRMRPKNQAEGFVQWSEKPVEHLGISWSLTKRKGKLEFETAKVARTCTVKISARRETQEVSPMHC